jgi:hypothetical protein
MTERLCFSCTKFEIDMGCAGYSEYTPGSPGYLGCDAGHFSWGGDDRISPKVLNREIHRAATCSDYSVADWYVEQFGDASPETQA